MSAKMSKDDQPLIIKWYNIGTWSMCKFEGLFFRSGKEEERGGKGERERECVCEWEKWT